MIVKTSLLRNQIKHNEIKSGMKPQPWNTYYSQSRHIVACSNISVVEEILKQMHQSKFGINRFPVELVFFSVLPP